MARNIWKMIKEIKEQVMIKNIGSFAAATAFFLFLSFVPMLILICTLLPYTPLTEDVLIQSVTGIFPVRIEGFLLEMLGEIYEKSAGTLSMAALITLWSAGKGMLALAKGLNAVNETEEKRNYFISRLVASFYTLVLLVIIFLSVLLNVFGNVLLEVIVRKLPRINELVVPLLPFRFLAVWGLVALLFAAIYTYVPDNKLHFKKQLPGAVIAAGGWSIYSWAFSGYVEWGGYSIYGSLSVIALLMLFLYFGMYIVLLGAQINHYWNRDRNTNLDNQFDTERNDWYTEKRI